MTAKTQALESLRGTRRASAMDMDSYISSELIAKLREQQRTLRRSLDALETSVMNAGKRGAGEPEGLVEECRRFAVLYQAHERLVGALLEAVEPDNPLPQSQGLR